MWVASSWRLDAWLGEEIETERRKFEVLREEKAEMEMENEPWMPLEMPLDGDRSALSIHIFFLKVGSS